MKIIGIDPGLQVCGYAAIEVAGGEERLLEAGVIRTDAKRDLARRLVQIGDDFGGLVDRFRPDQVAVEQLYAHYKHPRTAILMGHARGVIFQLAAAGGAQVISFSATRIKKSLTGHGRAGKMQMQRAIQSMLGLPELPEPADVADAIAVALCCANANNSEALDKLAKTGR